MSPAGLRGRESEQEVGTLGVEVLSVGRVDLPLLQKGEVEEVGRPVHLVVELFGVCQLQLILHVGIMPYTLE